MRWLRHIVRLGLFGVLAISATVASSVTTAFGAGPNWKICKVSGVQESPPCPTGEKPIELGAGERINISIKNVSGTRGEFLLHAATTEIKCLKAESITAALLGGKPARAKGRLLLSQCSVVGKPNCRVRSPGKAANSNEIESNPLLAELVYD